MIELVRQGACKRALQEMDEKAVQKMRPEQVRIRQESDL